jgi:hypothetical protein
VKIDAWQVPLLVMAGIILLELVIGPFLRRRPLTEGWRRGRTAALLLLAGLVVGVAVVALGPSLADQLASVAAAVAAVVALWLTYRAYRSYPTPSDPPPPSDVDTPPS